MNLINEDNLILEKKIFSRTEIEKRMVEGGFITDVAIKYSDNY